MDVRSWRVWAGNQPRLGVGGAGATGALLQAQRELLDEALDVLLLSKRVYMSSLY